MTVLDRILPMSLLVAEAGDQVADANAAARGGAVHRVAILALDAVVPIDLAIPAQVFDGRDGSPYRVTLCAAAAGAVRTTTGFDVVATAGLDELRNAGTIVVPGFSPHTLRPPERVLAALAD